MDPHNDPPAVTEVIVDMRRNVLMFELDCPLGHDVEQATIDIGALGRLIGIELGDTYLPISDAVPGGELQGRTVTIDLSVECGSRSIVLPRRGVGWEISFPSGNQCWTRSTEGGRATLCSVIG